VTLRLETIAPDLVEELTQADAVDQRRVATAVAAFAAERTDLTADELSQAFTAIRAETFGDSPVRAGVQQLTDRLDEEQWAVQERVDEGQATPAEHLTAFSAARAASAVYYALDADPETAALEALYEANAATDDLESLRHVVRQRLRT
jgi:hypothetical protein